MGDEDAGDDAGRPVRRLFYCQKEGQQMSDTTTITPDERRMWASVATARINAVTPERQCEITAQERLVKALKSLEQAEANVARLTKMVDWLADKLIDCPQVFTNCALDCAECRKEAASRAVADADSEVK